MPENDEDDPALTTALDVLDGLVCECGHVEADHSFWDDSSACESDDEPICDCTEFRPVDFYVTRANEKGRTP